MRTIKYLATVAVLSMASIASAQYDDFDHRDKFRFGLKAGLNYSNIYNSKGSEFSADPKIGFAGGMFASIPLGKYLGVQPEIMFSQKGFKGNGLLIGSNYEVNRTSNFLDVPLQVALKPSEFFTLLAGVQYSFLISQKDEFTVSSTSFDQEQEFKNDDLRNNILGFVAGVDVNVDKLVVSGRVSWDMTSNRSDGSSETPKYKNALVQATIGYSF
jgi:hypothetical protein